MLSLDLYASWQLREAAQGCPSPEHPHLGVWAQSPVFSISATFCYFESMQRVCGERGPIHRLGSQRCQSAHRKAVTSHRLIAQCSPLCDISEKWSQVEQRGPQGVHRRLMPPKSATSNGAQAKNGGLARSRDSEDSSSVTHQQGSATQDAETKVKVSDKLKAAVKQVDKSAYEVPALPMHLPQDVSLAPHRREHPGQPQVYSAISLAIKMALCVMRLL